MKDEINVFCQNMLLNFQAGESGRRVMGGNSAKTKLSFSLSPLINHFVLSACQQYDERSTKRQQRRGIRGLRLVPCFLAGAARWLQWSRRDKRSSRRCSARDGGGSGGSGGSLASRCSGEVGRQSTFHTGTMGEKGDFLHSFIQEGQRLLF